MELSNNPVFPSLSYSEWADTKTTLHLYTQMIGKIRLALHPAKNHWWHVTFYLTSRGLSTGPIPYGHGVFSIEFDLLSHRLCIETSTEQAATIQLQQDSVASFYRQVFKTLNGLGIDVSINPNPFDPSHVGSDIPFGENTVHGQYEPELVVRFHQILTQIYPIFARLNSKFYGKCTPVHFFWHTFDYALTFFSGRAGPDVSQLDVVSQAAYSHEVISFGFWTGDENTPYPAFYSYTFPEPEKLSNTPLIPADKANWVKPNGSHLAILSYDDMRQTEQPADTLFDFFQSAFVAGATLAKWDLDNLYKQ